jgi:four helix bundle protein
MELAKAVYRATETFPKHELYGITNQMRRAAVSVPSNIAEGKGHRSNREFERFLLHARGSLLELETQIILSGDLAFGQKEHTHDLLQRTTEVARSLNALINSLHRVTAEEISSTQQDWPEARAND